MNPKENQQNDIYGVQSENGQNPLQMNGHSKDISPVNNIEKPTGPISPAVQRLASQDTPNDVVNNLPTTPNPSVTNPVMYPSEPISNPSFQPDTAPASPQVILASTPPQSAPQKNKKPLFAAIIVAVALLVFGGGSAAVYALWYSNPDKVFFDAVSNLARSQTMITKGKVVYADEQNKGEVTVDFVSESDNPKLAGSLSADLNINYPDAKFHLKGAGMVADTGNIYFKIDNASELFEEALKSQYGAMITQDQSTATLVEKLRAFIKKIDGKWILAERADLGDSYEKQQTCYKKELDQFYKDSIKQREITDLYAQYKFINIKDGGKSESVNGQDSVMYNLTFDAKQAEKFNEAAEKTSLYKVLDKCGNSTESKYEDNLSEQSSSDIEKTQKQLDKITTKVWVSRWSHDFTKIQVNAKEESNTFDISATLDSKTVPNLAAPQNALKLKDLQKDIESIMQDAMTYTPDTNDTMTNTQDINDAYNSSLTTKHKTDAHELASQVSSYRANNRGQYPKTVSDIAPYLDDSLKTQVSDQPPDALNPDRIQYKYVGGEVGYEIYYWDEELKVAKSISGGDGASSPASQDDGEEGPITLGNLISSLLR